MDLDVLVDVDVDVDIELKLELSRGCNRSVLVVTASEDEKDEECNRCLTLARWLLFRLDRDRNMVIVCTCTWRPCVMLC